MSVGLRLRKLCSALARVIEDVTRQKLAGKFPHDNRFVPNTTFRLTISDNFFNSVKRLRSKIRFRAKLAEIIFFLLKLTSTELVSALKYM